MQSQEFGRSVHVDEVFQQTHIRKSTGQFVDDRSKKKHVGYFYYITIKFFTIFITKTISSLEEEFESRYSRAMFEFDSTAGASQCSQLDLVEEERLRNKCWHEAASGNIGDVYMES